MRASPPAHRPACRSRGPIDTRTADRLRTACPSRCGRPARPSPSLRPKSATLSEAAAASASRDRRRRRERLLRRDLGFVDGLLGRVDDGVLRRALLLERGLLPLGRARAPRPTAASAPSRWPSSSFTRLPVSSSAAFSSPPSISRMRIRASTLNTPSSRWRKRFELRREAREARVDARDLAARVRRASARSRPIRRCRSKTSLTTPPTTP